MWYQYSLTLIVFMFISQGITAQEQLNFNFRHITPADGLLHNEVPAIEQDARGFIWIATSNGLQRYDGYRFTYYPEMLSDGRARVTEGVELFADKKTHTLWIRKNGVIEKLDNEQKHFTYFKEKDILKDTGFHFTSYAGRDKESWLLGEKALFKYDSIAVKYIGILLNIFPSAPAVKNGYTQTDMDGRTWLPMDNNLLVFDPGTKEVFSADHNGIHHPLLDFFAREKIHARFVFIDSGENIWITTWGDAFYKYNAQTNKIISYSLSTIREKQQNKPGSAASLLINCMMEDRNQNIWIATENAGLLRYSPATDVFDYCITQENNSTGIKYNYKIFTLITDNNQDIWIGTDRGISIFNPYRQLFTAVRNQENNPQRIIKSEITSCLIHPDGRIFLGTWGGGINIYDSMFHYKTNLYQRGKLWNNYVWCMLMDDSDNLWVGCQRGTLMKINAKGKIQALTPPELEGSTIRCMEKDKYGNIWFGLHNGKIANWNKSTQKFYAYSNPGEFPTGSAVLKIYIDNNDACWVSTEMGFRKFDVETRSYTHTWLASDKGPGNISGTTTQGIEPLNDSILMIGTVYGGINFFNKRAYKFTHLTTADGLPSNNIHALKKDSYGYVWFTTDFGLYKFKPGENRFISYPIETGIINSSFSAITFSEALHGRWLTFNSTEAISFDPRELTAHGTITSGVTITGFKLAEHNQLTDVLLIQNKSLKLEYQQNFFTIEFATLNYSNPQQVNYQYQLSGIDKDWVSSGARPFASFTNIPPGDYTFKVRAENAGVPGPVTDLHFSIEPPFWKTKWFLIGCLLIATGIIYWLVKARIKNIRNEEKQVNAFNKKMAEMEMKALRSQMNPHFIFNCINSIDALIQSNDKYHATMYLNKFAKLIRNILDSSKQNTVTLTRDLETLKLYIELEQLRHENKFTAEINADDILLQEDYKVPPLIIQPFVENAILHGIRYRPDNKGRLCVTVKEQSGNLHYIIEDNGVGRNNNHHLPLNEKISYGIEMSNDRVKLFNNEEQASVHITDLTENGTPSGTRVEVLLKI